MKVEPLRGVAHLAWIPGAAVVGFLASYVFADRTTLPVDLYYLVYFTIVAGFFAAYVKRTELELREWLFRRLAAGLLLGVIVGALLAANVMSRPPTEPLTGGLFWWALLWRGLVYGMADGLLLLAFPWIVAWRAFGAEEAGLRSKLAASGVGWVGVLAVTTAYHLGYGDFRSSKILQPNVGSAIGAVATLATASPVASPIAHVFLHVAAVVHTPHTDLYLPPHRLPESTGLAVRTARRSAGALFRGGSDPN